MKLEQAIQIYREYHKMNSGKNTIESYGITISSKVIELAARRYFAVPAPGSASSGAWSRTRQRERRKNGEQRPRSRHSHAQKCGRFVNSSGPQEPAANAVSDPADYPIKHCSDKRPPPQRGSDIAPDEIPPIPEHFAFSFRMPGTVRRPGLLGNAMVGFLSAA